MNLENDSGSNRRETQKQPLTDVFKMRVPKNFTIFTAKHLCWISFWNFRTATFENNFGGLLLKRKQKRRMTHSDYCDFRFSLFPGQLFIKLWNKLFVLDYVIHFYIHMKGLSSPVFTFQDFRGRKYWLLLGR